PTTTTTVLPTTLKINAITLMVTTIVKTGGITLKEATTIKGGIKVTLLLNTKIITNLFLNHHSTTTRTKATKITIINHFNTHIKTNPVTKDTNHHIKDNKPSPINPLPLPQINPMKTLSVHSFKNKRGFGLLWRKVKKTIGTLAPK
ncbi:hypothetical protein HN51_054759, partial [Arachis hypogaea]